MREPQLALKEEDIDMLIADLPQPPPPGHLREDFYRTLDQAPNNLLFMRLARATAVFALILLLLTLPYILSIWQTATGVPAPAQATGTNATRTPQFTPSPLAVGPNAPFNRLKLKLHFSADGVPPDPAEVLPIMREDFTTYIQSLPEGFATLSNGVEFFNLQTSLSPHAPYGLILKLEDVDGDNERELVVGILPPVLIIEPDENGDVQITELPWPDVLPAIGTSPTRIDTGDFDGNGRPDIRIVYSHVDYPDRENETIVVTYEGQQWVTQTPSDG
jgi:hypothetical protein